MEIFIDFGLFELLAAIGLVALCRTIYARKFPAILFLVVSAAAPVVMIFLAANSRERWIAVICLATALVNAAAISAVLQNGGIPRLKFPQFQRRRAALPQREPTPPVETHPIA